MKWRGRKSSRNIEDRRRLAPGKAGIGGIGLIVILLIGYFLGIDVSPLLEQPGGQSSSSGSQITAADEEAAQFVSVTLADTEDIWTSVFKTQLNSPYSPPVLVLYKGVTQSPCGGASGASGPFYCPGDKKVYLDTEFFTTMSRHLGAKGDFAAAYVVAHEVAHHVQNELGILGDANRARQKMNARDSNRVSVMIELQADCLSGIWARYAEEKLGTLEPGDLEEAVNAAKQIGDDTLQRNAGQRPNPHSFTHGSSKQRQEWFLRGYNSADLKQCDTFDAENL